MMYEKYEKLIKMSYAMETILAQSPKVNGISFYEDVDFFSHSLLI